MPYAQERYLVQGLERVEQTFLSAHITQFETSVSCVSVPQYALRLTRRKTNGTDYRITIRPADAKPCDKRSTFQESRELWRNPLYCLHAGRTTFWRADRNVRPTFTSGFSTARSITVLAW